MMIRKMLALLLVAGIAGCSSEEKPKKEEGTVVEFGNIKSTAPAAWKKEEPKKSAFPRAYQFRLPGTEEGKNDAELVVFSGIGGTAKANIDRWKGQFTPSGDRKIDDVSRVEEIKVAGHPALMLDVSGAYAGMGGGVKSGWRMIGVHLDGPNTVYHILLRGPEATIAKHKPGFDDWLKSFK